MKKMIEIENGGLESLLGQKVTCLCVNYFYTGTLTGVNKDCIELTGPAIVYETGNWSETTYTDAQNLPADTILVMTACIESIGQLK